MIDHLPAWIDKELFSAYCAMRASMPKSIPFTPFAQKLIVKDLMRFHADGYDPNAALEESIKRGWRGVFQPKERRKTERAGVDPALAKIDADKKITHAPNAEQRAKIKQLLGER